MQRPSPGEPFVGCSRRFVIHVFNSLLFQHFAKCTHRTGKRIGFFCSETKPENLYLLVDRCTIVEFSIQKSSRVNFIGTWIIGSTAKTTVMREYVKVVHDDPHGLVGTHRKSGNGAVFAVGNGAKF